MTATDDQVWALWDVHMRAGGCTERTIKNRRIWFRELGRSIGKPIATATKLDLVEYLGRAHLSPRTRQNYRSAMHTLYTLLQDEGIRPDNPAARLPRRAHRTPRAPPVHHRRSPDAPDLRHLRQNPPLRAPRRLHGPQSRRDRRPPRGTRRLGPPPTMDRSRQGRCEGLAPPPPAHLDVIQDLPHDGYWFPSHTIPGQPINPKSVSNTLCGAVKRAGLAGHRAHQLRATFATEMIRAGVSTTVASHAMRHANPATLSPTAHREAETAKAHRG